MRRQLELEAGLDDRGTDRIVAAAGAERGYRAFVVAPGEAQLVGRQLRMMKLRFGDVGHKYRLEALGTRREVTDRRRESYRGTTHLIPEPEISRQRPFVCQ